MPNLDNYISKLSKLVDFDLMTACRVECHFAESNRITGRQKNQSNMILDT